MVLDAGAEKVVPIKDLNNKLKKSYSLIVLNSLMLSKGITDFVTSTGIPAGEVIPQAMDYVKKDAFSSIPLSIPNYNLINMYMANEFLSRSLYRKFNIHIMPETKFNNEKLSSDYIKDQIIMNDMVIPENIKKLMPDFSVDLLEEELDNIDLSYTKLLNKINTISRGQLLNTANLTLKSTNILINDKPFRNIEEVYDVLFSNNYCSEQVQLILSSIDSGASKSDLFDQIQTCETMNMVPSNQKIDYIISKAWYIAFNLSKGLDKQDILDEFEKHDSVQIPQELPLVINANIYLFSEDLSIITEDSKVELYIDNKDELACKLTCPKDKMKRKLNVSRVIDLFIHQLLDTGTVPLFSKVIQTEKGSKIKINVGYKDGYIH